VTRAGADARLHERWSVGIGGHVNPEDGGVAGGLLREWTEELAAAMAGDERFVIVAPVALVVTNAGAELQELAIGKPSLEDVFIHLTGRTLR